MSAHVSVRMCAHCDCTFLCSCAAHMSARMSARMSAHVSARMYMPVQTSIHMSIHMSRSLHISTNMPAHICTQEAFRNQWAADIRITYKCKPTAQEVEACGGGGGEDGGRRRGGGDDEKSNAEGGAGGEAWHDQGYEGGFGSKRARRGAHVYLHVRTQVHMHGCLCARLYVPL